LTARAFWGTFQPVNPVREASLETVQHLIDRIDASVRMGEVHAVTSHVKTALCDLIRAHDVEIPERFVRPRGDHYARRLLYKNDKLGYTAVVMTWSPGQTTSLHDHAGMWCVEGVIAGQMSVTRFDLVEQIADRYRFTEVEQVKAGVGSSGALIPPYEYHVLANALPDRVSVTLHVYGGEMDHCSIFEPQADGLFVRHLKPLRYDD
jgi:predicted metal-dependent enzyme (double-stranded beta helix superfamily)